MLGRFDLCMSLYSWSSEMEVFPLSVFWLVWMCYNTAVNFAPVCVHTSILAMCHCCRSGPPDGPTHSTLVHPRSSLNSSWATGAGPGEGHGPLWGESVWRCNIGEKGLRVLQALSQPCTGSLHSLLCMYFHSSITPCVSFSPSFPSFFPFPLPHSSPSLSFTLPLPSFPSPSLFFHSIPAPLSIHRISRAAIGIPWDSNHHLLDHPLGGEWSSDQWMWGLVTCTVCSGTSL